MKKIAVTLGSLLLGCGLAFGQALPVKQEKVVQPAEPKIAKMQPVISAEAVSEDEALRALLADELYRTEEASVPRATVKRGAKAAAITALPYRCGFDTKDVLDNEWIVRDLDGDGRKWAWRDHDNYETYNGAENSGFVFSLFKSDVNDDDPQLDFLTTKQPIHMPKGASYVGLHYVSKMAGFRDSLCVYYGKESEPQSTASLTPIGYVINTETDWRYEIMKFEVPEDGDYYFHFVNASPAGGFGIWLDNIEIGHGDYVGYRPEIRVERLVLPSASCSMGRERLSMQVKNTGLTALTKVKMTYTVNGGTPVTKTLDKNIGVSEVVYLELAGEEDFSAIKDYRVEAEVEIVASVSGEMEADDRKADNKASDLTRHFSPASLPYAVDLKTEAGRAQVGYGSSYWTPVNEEGLYGLNGLMADAPLTTRCVTLDGMTVYRLRFMYKAGGMILNMAIVPSDFDILFGEAGTSMMSWETLAVVAGEGGGYTYDEYVMMEVLFTPEMSGDYSIAFVPRENTMGYNQELYISSIEIEQPKDYDLKLNRIQSSVGLMTPARHATSPSFKVEVLNRGSKAVRNAGVKARQGEAVVGVSDEKDVQSRDTAYFNLSAKQLAQPAPGSLVTLDFEVQMTEADEEPSDNKRSWSFTATDTLYAFDSLNKKYEDAVGIYGVAVGEVFTLAARDTLTAVAIGWYDISNLTSQTLMVGLEIYAVDVNGEIGNCLLFSEFKRRLEGGTQVVHLPARVMEPGRYFIAVRQLTSYNIALGYDESPVGSCYLMQGNQLQEYSALGYVAVRAVFGRESDWIPAKDMELVSIDRPRARGVFAANESILITYINNGYEELPVTVKCTVDGKETVASAMVAGYAIGQMRFEADLSAVGKHEIKIEAIVEGDEDPENNVLTKTVECVASDPYVMDFEYCDDFAIKGLAPWKTVDMDGKNTSGIEGLSWPNVGYPQAFMAFNPSAVPMDGIAPHDGERMGCVFASVKAQNNDWLISPKLRMPDQFSSLSFYSMAFRPLQYPERYNVWVSTTSDEISTFMQIGDTYTAPAAWEETVVDLSAFNGKEIWIAIQCVSDAAFIFMVDDIQVTRPVANENTADWKSAVRAYPNPASDMWTVTAYGLSIQRVEFCNMMGEVVYRSADHLSTETWRLNVAHFTPGLYMARVYTDAGVQTLKVVVR